MYNEALKRREHLFSNMSKEERTLFENYVEEIQESKNPNKKKSSSGGLDSLYIEILLIFAGLIFVYGLIIISSDKYYSPLDIFRIINQFFKKDD